MSFSSQTSCSGVVLEYGSLVVGPVVVVGFITVVVLAFGSKVVLEPKSVLLLDGSAVVDWSPITGKS